jgi:hypothetical protein
VTVAVTTIVFYGGHRIRSSMEPSVVIAAAVMIVQLLTRARPDGQSSDSMREATPDSYGPVDVDSAS